MIKVLAVAVLAVALSGCTSLKGMTPEQAHQLIVDFGAAGCGGRVDLDAGAATGQLGGAAHLALNMHGECPTRQTATWGSPAPVDPAVAAVTPPVQ